MKLSLQLTDSPLNDGSASSRSLEQGSLTIGRSAAADWNLPDPERVISRLHCRVDAVKDGFTLTDTSTNGVFLNGATAPLGQGKSVALRNGDRFRIGGNTIAVRLSATAETATLPASAMDGLAAAGASPFAIEPDFHNADWGPLPTQGAILAKPAASDDALGAIPENWFAPASAIASRDDMAGGEFDEAARLLAEALGITAPPHGEAAAFLARLGRQHLRLVEWLLQSLSGSVALRHELDVGEAGGTELENDRLPVAAILGKLVGEPAGESTLIAAIAALKHHQDALRLAFSDVLRALPADLAATLREVIRRGYAAAQSAVTSDGAADDAPPWPRTRK